MPKMKTHSGARKRFSKTGTGKIKARHNYRNHLLTKKSPIRKQGLHKAFYLCSSDVGHIKSVI